MNRPDRNLVIAQAMKDKKMSQADLGKKLGIASRTVRKWISGKCRLDQFDDLCSELGLTLTINGPVQALVIEGHFKVVTKIGRVNLGDHSFLVPDR